MGGGAQHLGLPMEPIDPDTCVRGDGKNLVEYWEGNNPDGKVVTNTEQLFSVDIANTSKILGIFATNHLPYHAVKTEDTPSLANMTKQAIKLLRKNDNGFLLMVSFSFKILFRPLSFSFFFPLLLKKIAIYRGFWWWHRSRAEE